MTSADAVAFLPVGPAFAGCLVHIAAAAVGLAALLELVPAAYLVLKYAGVAYLLYIGVRMLAAAGRAADAAYDALVLAVDDRAPLDAVVWTTPQESVRIGQLVEHGPILLVFYLFDWSST